ncbi:acyltransferase [Sphingomonas sp. AOB5]|uniref:acyltransferase family protein n=1 Tax=Sphingomonas sp. AOB5 TaxID=3034017 RepID=UPI0023F8AA67|nr:acyltransferase [Sphingomonas sp. AOB5]MDF7774422.1 acyltransferase [Sphingomonas sp. AOB5]
MTGTTGGSDQTMEQASNSSRDKLYNVQILRFVAALFVLVGHIFLGFERGYVKSEPVEFIIPVIWESGVDIFFIISGFIMYYVGRDAFGKSGGAADFIRRRLIRILPLYWFFTTLMLLSILFFTGAVNKSSLDVVHVICSYLFIPWYHPDGGWTPLLGPGWTLNYEMFFYVIFSIGLLFARRTGLILIASIFFGLVLLGELFDLPLVMLSFWTQPIILEFVFGVGLAIAYLQGVRLSTWQRLALIVLGFILGGSAAVHDFPFHTRVLWGGIPSLLIAAGVVLGSDFPEMRVRGWLVLGGDASYSLYLSHLFTLKVLSIVWNKIGIVSSSGYVVVALVVSVAVSVLAYRYIEQPLLELAKRWIMPRKVAPVAQRA